MYLFEVDAKFAQEFGVLFPDDAGIVNGAIYTVEADVSGGLSLLPLVQTP